MLVNAGRRAAMAICLLLCLLMWCGAAMAEKVTGDQAYIDNLKVVRITDGQAPFDADDKAGNDSGNANRIVRSFDSLSYDLEMDLAAHASDGDSANQYDEARICLAIRIPFTAEQMAFNTDSMPWMEPGYQVVSEDGGQTLYCSILRKPEDGAAVPGRQRVFVSLNVLKLRNAQEITPEFFAWIEGGNVHKAGWKPEDGRFAGVDFTRPQCAAHGRKELSMIKADPVTVSARLKLNIKLSNFGNTYNTVYDFDKGNGAGAATPAVHMNRGKLTGTGVSLGISVKLRSESASKGMRGMEYPDGSPITFDVVLDTRYVPDGTSDNLPISGTAGGKAYDFSPLLYSYGGYTYDYWNDDGRYVEQRLGLPDNRFTTNAAAVKYCCYNGGDWKAVQNGNTIRVTISNYAINGVFPVRNTPNVIPDVYGKELGYIASGEMHFLLPHYNQSGGTDGNAADFIAQILGSGSFDVRAYEGNLRAKSESGALAEPEPGTLPDVSNQVRGTDDTLRATAMLLLPGSYRNVAAFSIIEGTRMNQYDPLTPNCFENGKDWAYPGDVFSILAGVWSCDTRGFDDNRIVAYDDFLKIDSKAISFVDMYKGSTSKDNPGWLAVAELAGSATKGKDNYVDYTTTGLEKGKGQQIKLLYAVKRDGSHWVSDDEMRQTTQESDNLLWFDKFDDAQAKGEVVGLLFQYRGRLPGGIRYPRYKVATMINADARPGETYMTVHELRIWNAASLRNLGYVPEESLSGDALLKWYNDKIPLRTPQDDGYEDELKAYTDACCAMFGCTYNRLEYKEDGSTTGGTGSLYYGDTVYVADYSTKVSIDVINGLTNEQSGNHTFDIGAGQDVADFAVRPEMVMPSMLEADTQQALPCTKVTVRQTLPKGLIYIPGSSYWGGQYVAAPSQGRQGSVVPDERGFSKRLTDNGEISYVFTKDGRDYPITVSLKVSRKNDVTTLEYTFEGVPLLSSAQAESALGHQIYFSAEIDKREESSWTLTQSVTIQGEREKQAINESNGNKAVTSILVYQNKAEGLGLTADNLYNEQDVLLGWTINYKNDTSTRYSNALLFVRMPEDRYTGTYDFVEWTLDLNTLGTDGAGLELWYTTQDVANKTADDYTRDQLAAAGSGYTKITLGRDGSALRAELPQGAAHATAWILTGDIEPQKAFRVHQGVKPSGNEPGDAYRTAAYIRSGGNNALHSYATVYVVGRGISGLVWYDADCDGIRDGNEALLQGVTAELYRKMGGAYEKVTADVTGAALSAVTTGADGAYSFDKLAQGEYVIRFSGDALAAYTGETLWKAAAADDAHNSDAKAASGAYVTEPGAVFASAQQIARDYTQQYRNLDLGLVKTGSLRVTKTVTGDVPDADAGRAFDFALTLTLGGSKHTGSISCKIGSAAAVQLSPDSNGTYAFSLAHGQTAVLSGLPADAAYTVSEQAYGKYLPALSGETGDVGTQSHEVTCINAYDPDDTAYAPQVSKAVAGAVPPQDETFTFTLAHTGGDASGVTMPEETQVSIEGEGSASYGEIAFTRAGTYTFTITEEDVTAPGYGMDAGGAWTLTVVIQDRAGVLEVASAVYSRGGTTETCAAFINTYNVEPTAFAPGVNKHLAGDTPPQDETFTFTLAHTGGDASGVTMPERTQVSIEGEGSASYGEIGFTQAGTYTFTITEEIVTAPGYGMDAGGAWTLTVHVEDTDSKLGVTSAVYTRGQTTGAVAEFTNTYTVNPTTYAPGVKKCLAGVTPPRDETFTFTLAHTGGDASGLTLPESMQVSIEGEGSASYGEIAFSRAGTYTFTITEENVTAPGYGMDAGGAWTLSINVEDRAASLAVVSAVYTRGQTTGTCAEFTNTYSVTPATYAISVNKRVEGVPPLDETYTFELTGIDLPQDDSVVLPQSMQAQVTGAGEAVFEAITFVRAGQYAFAVRETPGTLAHCAYDSSVLTVSISVEDEGGRLSVKSVTFSRGGEAAPADFVNTYRSGSLEIKKRVEGNAADYDQAWTFTLLFRDELGVPLDMTFAYDGDVQGMICSGGSILLRHGERAVIHGLPEGTQYDVQETEADTDGYVTTAESECGVIITAETAHALYINRRDGVDLPETGDQSSLLYLAVLCLMSAAGMRALRRRQA